MIEKNLAAGCLRGEIQPRDVIKQIPIRPVRDLALDLYFRAGFRKNFGWKHMRVKSASTLARIGLVRQGRVAFVTLTRNPYSWLLSLHRRPYHQSSLRKLDFESFLGAPWSTLGRENAPSVVANPVALWNVKNASYLQLAPLGHLPLRFEDLLASPEKTVDLISQTFCIARKRSVFVNHDESTKPSARTSKDYQEYYSQERWLDDLSPRAISLINEGLDHDLVRHYGYKTL